MVANQAATTVQVAPRTVWEGTTAERAATASRVMAAARQAAAITRGQANGPLPRRRAGPAEFLAEVGLVGCCWVA
ncbi:hypothetical protein [Nonomuraea sp. NPDC049400]|uniref:hypothetical protein n=1 Tax=Nonomuraea sp. NPDC049400 TaxID=3364352 RepID=UPI0037ADAF9F